MQARTLLDTESFVAYQVCLNSPTKETGCLLFEWKFHPHSWHCLSPDSSPEKAHHQWLHIQGHWKSPPYGFPSWFSHLYLGPPRNALSRIKFTNLVWLAYYISGSRFPSTRNETSLLPQARLGGRGVQWMETASEAATRFSGHLTCFTVNCSLPLGHFDVTTLGLLLSSAVAKEKPHKICFVSNFSSC